MKDFRVASASNTSLLRRPTATRWASTAAALALALCGCNLMPERAARPIDGLRMTDQTETASPANTADIREGNDGELKRLDLRV